MHETTGTPVRGCADAHAAMVEGAADAAQGGHGPTAAAGGGAVTERQAGQSGISGAEGARAEPMRRAAPSAPVAAYGGSGCTRAGTVPGACDDARSPGTEGSPNVSDGRVRDAAAGAAGGAMERTHVAQGRREAIEVERTVLRAVESACAGARRRGDGPRGGRGDNKRVRFADAATVAAEGRAAGERKVYAGERYPGTRASSVRAVSGRDGEEEHDGWPDDPEAVGRYAEALRARRAGGDGLAPSTPMAWRTPPVVHEQAARATGRRRGERAAVFAGYCGWDAVSADLITHDRPAFWAGGFDMDPVPCDFVARRQLVRPLERSAEHILTCPEMVPSVDIICSGSPCQGASWAGYMAGDGYAPTPDDPRNRLYAQQPEWITRRADAAIVEFLSSVRRGRFLTEMHQPMLAGFHRRDWTTFELDMCAADYGASTPRNRVYTLAFSPRVVAAAHAAGVRPPEVPQMCTEMPRMHDVLVDDATIDRCHAHLWTGHVLDPPPHDWTHRRDVSVAPFAWVTLAGASRPVWAAEAPGLPLKVRGAMPLVKTLSGRVRFMMLPEFVRLGGLPWAVGFADEPLELPRAATQAKKYAGNTWDAHLTDIVMSEALRYMRPYLRSRADEPADDGRVRAFLAAVVARHALPARRALRTWAAVAQAERAWLDAQRAPEPRLVYRVACGTAEMAVRRHPLDSLAMKGYELVDAATTDGDYEPTMLPLPETRRPPATAPRPPPAIPTPADIAAFEARYKHWTSLFSTDGLQQLLKWCEDSSRDATQAAKSCKEGARAPHRWRAGELRVGGSGLDAWLEANRPLVAVRQDGSPTLLVPQRETEGAHVKVRFGRIRRWMRARTWEDEALDMLCEWGADDECAKRPYLVAASPNTAAAYALYDKVSAAFDAEIEAGWIIRRDAQLRIAKGGDGQYSVEPAAAPTDHDPTPAFVPQSAPPTNAREKTDAARSARLFANTSWPLPDGEGASWEGRPVAPNGLKEPGMLPAFEWASVEAMAQAVGIICAIAVACGGLRPLGACDDLRKWFRQIPAATTAHPQQVFAWGGRFMADRMVQMGRFASAHTAQRLSFVIAEIWFEQVLDLALEWLDAAVAADRCEAPLLRLVVIVRLRTESLGRRHCGLFHTEVCQDDLGWFAVCPQVAWIAWHTLPGVLAALGVEYSQPKRDEQGAPLAAPKYMGVVCDTTTVGSPVLRAAEDKRSKFIEMAAAWTEVAGGLAHEDKYAETLGLGVFLCKSIRRGRMLLNQGFACMAARRGDMKPVSHAWLADLATLKTVVECNAGAPMLVDPRWMDAGPLGIAGDASVSDAAGGFGGNVLACAFHGEWTDEERRLLDISTLELYTVVFLAIVAGFHAGLRGKRLVMRSDNIAAVNVINRMAPQAPPMEAALRALHAACEAAGVEVLMEHIPGVRNTIADKYSRGDVSGADAELGTLVGRTPEHVEIPAQWRRGPPMRAVLAAAARWRPQGVSRAPGVV